MFGEIKVSDVIHDFKDCLQFSHEFEDNPIWLKVYKKAFPSMISIISYRADGFWQRDGIDRGIILSTTKQIFIDEKVRGRNKKTGKVYTDIALEYVSNDRTNSPGWIIKPLRADYIAYLIAPIGRCFLLPVIQLQNAWFDKGEQWKIDYPNVIRAPNAGYNTLSCGVPVIEVYKSIREQLIISFEPFEL